MKKPKRRKAASFFDLTPDERERELVRFDQPIDIEKDTRPMTKRERAIFDRMNADKPDLTLMVRDGRHDVIVHLDKSLLAQAAAYARRHRTTLPKMIDRGLRGLLSFGA